MASFFKRTYVWVPVVTLLALIAGLYIGAKFLHGFNNDSRLEKLGELIGIIDENYVDEVNLDSILDASIPDLLAKLDPHSEYIPAADLKAVNEELDGSFSGVGISFNMLTDTITVVEVIPGGPSERAGILAGDRILTINDSVIDARVWSTDRVIKNLKGQKGTTVRLGIQRSSSPSLLTFEVVRGDVPMNSVDASYMLDGETGYVKVNKFGRNTFSEFLTAMTKLRGMGAKKYVIDLRGNGGGYMDVAILMANEFLRAGSPIVSTLGRVMEQPMLSADGTGSFTEEELVVLIDEFSASASEIFSGAIQDNDRGLIVGRRSFGKGLVQNQLSLSDSSAVRLTIARYYTPSGRCIQKTYTPGNKQGYGNEVVNRFVNGEAYNADSIHLDKSQIFHTLSGRAVYGGGGIMPDVFIPNDTSGITSYYINVINAGLIQKYAFSYADANREQLHRASTADEVLSMLPSDDQMLQDFAYYARSQGIMPRWYYINISRNLIVNHMKALIARDVLGMSAYYEVINRSDDVVKQALQELAEGKAGFPIRPSATAQD